MATVNCINCGREVSTRLIVCPDCATPVGYVGGTPVKIGTPPLAESSASGSSGVALPDEIIDTWPAWQQVLLFVGLLAQGAFIVWVAWGLTDDWRASQAARNWPTTEGRIISSSFSSCRNCEYGPLYDVDITFQYSVEGRTYTRERWTFGSDGYGSKKDADRIIQQYPAGTAANVTYDPSNPERGYLDTTFRFAFEDWIFFVGILLLELWLIYEGMRRAPRLLLWLWAGQRSRNPE